MATSLFTGQTPAVADANDGTDYTLGTALRRSNSGQIVRGRWYCPTTPPTGTPDFVLYDSSGTELHREPWPGIVGGQWNETPDFEVPVDYTANDLIVASVYTSGQYCATVDPAFWNSADLVNDDITAPGSENGRLSNVDSYPSNVVDLCFFVDVVFAGAASPAEGEAELGLELAVAATGARASAGAAAAGLQLAVAATGARDSAGAAAAGLQLAVAATGARASLGQAAPGLVFTVHAVGARPSLGSAALGLALMVAAAGPVAEVTPGTLTASGRPLSTLTAGGSLAATLTASGRP